MDFIHEQWSTIPPLATADLVGKTVMVIGANTGLGFEASKHFARMNPARLILGCRSPTKGEAAVESEWVPYPAAVRLISSKLNQGSRGRRDSNPLSYGSSTLPDSPPFLSSLASLRTVAVGWTFLLQMQEYQHMTISRLRMDGNQRRCILLVLF
jgi:hypothetical protein